MIHPGPPARPEPRRTPPSTVISHASISSGRHGALEGTVTVCRAWRGQRSLPAGDRGAGRINKALGGVAGRGGGQLRVVNLELVLLARSDPVVRRANVPPEFVLLQRINLGLYAVLAGLGATADWRRIAEEIWPWVAAAPSTELGRTEAAWRTERNLEPG